MSTAFSGPLKRVLTIATCLLLGWQRYKIE
jgi:hypothetical protein